MKDFEAKQHIILQEPVCSRTTLSIPAVWTHRANRVLASSSSSVRMSSPCVKMRHSGRHVSWATTSSSSNPGSASFSRDTTITGASTRSTERSDESTLRGDDSSHNSKTTRVSNVSETNSTSDHVAVSVMPSSGTAARRRSRSTTRTTEALNCLPAHGAALPQDDSSIASSLSCVEIDALPSTQSSVDPVPPAAAAGGQPRSLPLALASLSHATVSPLSNSPTLKKQRNSLHLDARPDDASCNAGTHAVTSDTFKRTLTRPPSDREATTASLENPLPRIDHNNGQPPGKCTPHQRSASARRWFFWPRRTHYSSSIEALEFSPSGPIELDASSPLSSRGGGTAATIHSSSLSGGGTGSPTVPSRGCSIPSSPSHGDGGVPDSSHLCGGVVPCNLSSNGGSCVAAGSLSSGAGSCVAARLPSVSSSRPTFIPVSPTAQFAAVRILVLSLVISLLLLTNSFLRIIMETAVSPVLELTVSVVFPVTCFLVMRAPRKANLMVMFSLSCLVPVVEFFSGALAASELVSYLTLTLSERGCRDVERVSDNSAAYTTCRKSFIILGLLCCFCAIAFFLSIFHAWHCYTIILECSIWKHQHRQERARFSRLRSTLVQHTGSGSCNNSTASQIPGLACASTILPPASTPNVPVYLADPPTTVFKETP